MAAHKSLRPWHRKKSKAKTSVKKNARAIAKLNKEQYKKCQYYDEPLTDNAANILLVKCINPTN
jgi:hypothetical protein